MNKTLVCFVLSAAAMWAQPSSKPGTPIPPETIGNVTMSAEPCSTPAGDLGYVVSVTDADATVPAFLVTVYYGQTPQCQGCPRGQVAALVYNSRPKAANYLFVAVPGQAPIILLETRELSVGLPQIVSGVFIP